LAADDHPQYLLTDGTRAISGLTASELVATDGSKVLQSLAVATYPSLAEIAYVKGVTSAIQTQLNAKAAIQGYVEWNIEPGAWAPYTTGGATPVETVYGSNEFDSFSFDSATEQAIRLAVKMPQDYNGGTIRWNFDWDALATATGTIVAGLSAGSFGDSDALSTALGTERTLTTTISLPMMRQALQSLELQLRAIWCYSSLSARLPARLPSIS
jgi:hypothetical protein